MKKGWSKVAFEEVFDLDLDSVNVDASASYQMVGVLSYGRGLFGKPPVAGTDTSYKTFYRSIPGRLSFRNYSGGREPSRQSRQGLRDFLFPANFQRFARKRTSILGLHVGWFAILKSGSS